MAPASSLMLTPAISEMLYIRPENNKSFLGKEKLGSHELQLASHPLLVYLSLLLRQDSFIVMLTVLLASPTTSLKSVVAQTERPLGIRAREEIVVNAQVGSFMSRLLTSSPDL